MVAQLTYSKLKLLVGLLGTSWGRLWLRIRSVQISDDLFEYLDPEKPEHLPLIFSLCELIISQLWL